MNKIESIRIRGFRSLADIELTDLPNVSVMIGPNGSGKSNIIRFFEMLSWMLRSRRLNDFVQERGGGADDQLFQGRRVTPLIEAAVSIRTEVGRNEYRFTLVWAQPDRLIFTDESFRFSRDGIDAQPDWQSLGSGHGEARLVDAAQEQFSDVNATTARTVLYLLRNCVAYQFHDTSHESRFKQRWDVEDCSQLRSDGGNLASVLLHLEREDIRRYELIRRQIGRILPTFDRFEIEERYGKALLRWRAKDSDKVIGAHLTSDGSLRFFALVTLLNLPSGMLPDVLLLDEPELGLHPAAVELVGHMICRVGLDRQVFVATQSSLLVDIFDLDQIAVLDLEDGRTKCRQLSGSDYAHWLEDDYLPSDLWLKNVLGGRP